MKIVETQVNLSFKGLESRVPKVVAVIQVTTKKHPKTERLKNSTIEPLL